MFLRSFVDRDAQGDFELLGDLSNLLRVSFQKVLERVSQVLEDVPAVKNLLGLRCAFCTGFGVFVGSVSGDDLDFWMGFEPRYQRLGGTIWKQIHDRALLVINNDRAVGVTFLECKVINTNDFQRAHRIGCCGLVGST